MISFYLMMFILPAGIIALAIFLSHKEKRSRNG